MLGREKTQIVEKEWKLKTMESVFGFFFCVRIHMRVCLESRNEGSVYGRIPYEPGCLTILQAAKRIADRISIS